MAILKDRSAKAINRDFVSVTHDFWRESGLLAESLASSELDPVGWYEQFYDLLLGKHTSAWSLGRNLAGDTAALGNDDRVAGLAMAEEESRYLQGFLSDVIDGKFLDADGNIRTDLIKNRSALYGRKLRGTANESFISVSGSGYGFHWRLGANDHCADCPQMPDLEPDGGFTMDTLPFWPGDGRTACKVNCTCWLVRTDGVKGFTRVEAEAV
ncbi:MAG: hypothetical protein ACOYOL_07205 [Chthoniobacterales bacterium]